MNYATFAFVEKWRAGRVTPRELAGYFAWREQAWHRGTRLEQRPGYWRASVAQTVRLLEEGRLVLDSRLVI